MKEHISDLASLAKKYNDLVKDLETRLDEAKRKLLVVSEAIDLLRKEGIFEQEKLFDTPLVLSDQYSQMSMTDAIRDILKANNKLDTETIYSELIKHGFQSQSKALKRDVYTRLFRLEQKGILVSEKEGGIKKYSLMAMSSEAENLIMRKSN